MKMHVLSGGRLRMKRRIFYPDADRREKIDLPVSCFLFRHPQGNVLFDTGCHSTVADDPIPRWGNLSKVLVPIMGPNDNVVRELATLNLSPTDIDLVVNSHFHPDHCGCNEFFTKATIICHEKELEHVKKPNALQLGYFRADWDHPMPIEVINSEKDLFGDERLVLLPLPGHSPGLTGLLANLDHSGSFLLTSDAVCVRENLDLETIPRMTWNADLLLQSVSEIKRIEAGGVTVVCGHDPTQWASLKKGMEAYD